MNEDISGTKAQLLDAAKTCILESGYASVTTRMVADKAGVPLSQIHYHFGSKHALMLSLTDYLNSERLELYEQVFEGDATISDMWLKLGEVLLNDLETGYTRVMQELIAASFSDEKLRSRVADQFHRWHDTLSKFGAVVEHKLGSIGPLNGREFAGLLDAVAIGINQRMLLGISEKEIPGMYALNRFTLLFKKLEEDVALTTEKQR
jgi:AcrR family transcriptional regulator